MAVSTEKKERNGFSVISEKELLVVNGGQVSLPSYHVPQKENGVSVGWGTLSIQDGNTTINVSPSGVSVSKSK